MTSELSLEQEILLEVNILEKNERAKNAGSAESAKSAVRSWASSASTKSFNQALKCYTQNRSAMESCIVQDIQNTTQGGDSSVFKLSNGQTICKAHATILSHLNKSVIYDRWYRYSCEALSRKDTLPTSVERGKGLVKKREAIERKWGEMIMWAGGIGLDGVEGTEGTEQTEKAIEGKEVAEKGAAADDGEDVANDSDGSDRTVKANEVD